MARPKHNPDHGMTQAEYAEHRRSLGLIGCNPRTISDALDSGRISKNDYGYIDPVQADIDWEENTDRSKQQRLVNQDDCDIELEDVPSFTISHARVEHLRAEQQELKLAQMRGELVDVAEIEAELFSVARSVRDHILTIPFRVAPIIASYEDPKVVEEILEKELLQSLEYLSQLHIDNYQFETDTDESNSNTDC